VSLGIEALDKSEHPILHGLWIFFSNLKMYEFKFAFKTAVTITLMALPAFLEATQDIFYAYRMSWSMSSAIVVMSYSVGGTNAAGVYRILGTLGGALLAILVWYTFPEQPIPLFFATALTALPCYYVFFTTLHKKFAQVNY
jgi:uncharacterized membrane protein YccC